MDYNKPTWQTHEKYSSAKAVDVLFETHSGGGDQCAMSYKSTTDVTWMVDLEDIYSIYQVVIFHKTDGVTFGKYTDSSMTMFFFTCITIIDSRCGIFVKARLLIFSRILE